MGFTLWRKAVIVTTMDRILKDTNAEIAKMQLRFLERAKAITKAQMPPLEGEMRREWINQKEADYQDFLMIADCNVKFEDGVLSLTLDLRPKICDATLREQGIVKDNETETRVAMGKIAAAPPKEKELKTKIGLSGYNPYFEYGGEG